MISRPRPAVFLDRDDTVNVNAELPDTAFSGRRGDLLSPAHVRLIDGAREACEKLHGAGYRLVVVTNQGGVARAGGTLADVDRTNDALRALVADRTEPARPPVLRRGPIDAFYSCPFHPDGDDDRFAFEHEWRKPGPGMILAATAELSIDLAASWLVGDKPRDVDAAVEAGIAPERALRIGPGQRFRTLMDATAHILNSRDHTPVRWHKGPVSTVTLRASGATPLSDTRTRETVVATAHAIAERTGVAILAVRTTPSSITAEIATNRLAALGFLAELRRLTNAWHRTHADGDQPLWPASADVGED